MRPNTISDRKRQQLQCLPSGPHKRNVRAAKSVLLVCFMQPVCEVKDSDRKVCAYIPHLFKYFVSGRNRASHHI